MQLRLMIHAYLYVLKRSRVIHPKKVKKRLKFQCFNINRARDMLFVFLLVSFLYVSEAPRAPTWDLCGCKWMSWQAWSQCSASCGGGRRYRSRKVWNYINSVCDPLGFNACASDDMGNDYDNSCNAICYHGYHSGKSCTCHAGWYGKCCNNRTYIH